MAKIIISGGFWDEVPGQNSKKRRAWFRRRVEWMLRGNGIDNEREITEILDVFTDDIDFYLTWQDNKVYHGRNYACGYWEVDEADIWKDLPGIRAKIALRAIGSIDEFLTLLDAGKLPSAAPEPMGLHFYKSGSPEYSRFIAWRDKADRTWPRLCGRCRKEFRPSRRNAVNCNQCRPAARRRGHRKGGKAS